MKVAISLKRFLAVLILLCFFLPLSQCSVGTKAAPSDTGRPVAAQEEQKDVLVPAKAVDGSFSSILFAAAFFWPLATSVIPRRGRGRRTRAAVSVAEAILGLCSGAYLALVIHMYGSPRYGGILVVSCYAAYAVLCSWKAFTQFRER